MKIKSKVLNLRSALNNTEGIYTKNFIWRELRNFLKECAILILAVTHDSIKDYQGLLRMLERSEEKNG